MSHPRMPFSAQPDDVGLYRRDFEHDACGVAMKATKAGQIIGYAMQSSGASKDGKVLVWLQLGTYIPPATLDTLNALPELQAEIAALKTEVAALKAGK